MPERPDPPRWLLAVLPLAAGFTLGAGAAGDVLLAAVGTTAFVVSVVVDLVDYSRGWFTDRRLETER